MNSAQRRKSKREHPHIITIRASTRERYFEHDERVGNAVKWCKKNCKGSWKWDDTWDSAEFKFAVHKDAMMFALKWL
jgi:hypothetical protein